ncbi:unnamed protein product, partial [Medioppia subpectinata]
GQRPEPLPKAKRYVCRDHGKSFANRYEFNEHQYIVHGLTHPYLCEYDGYRHDMRCNKQYDREFDYVRHQRRQHSIRVHYECEYSGCDQYFDHRSAIKEHITKMHGKQRPFVCDRTDCGQSFGRETQLYAHKLRVHSEPIVDQSVPKPKICQYECDYKNCFGMFATEEILQKHKKSVHQNHDQLSSAQEMPAVSIDSTTSQVLPGLSNDSAVSQTVLTGLSSISSVDTQHSVICNTDRELRTHLKTTRADSSGHTVTYSEKRYKCDKCSQTYRRDCQLKRHQKSRHGVREPYRCSRDGCDRRYAKQSLLEAHKLAKHRTDMLYRCRYGQCECGFESERQLNQHRRIEHAIHYPYRCLRDPCDSGAPGGYSTYDMLREHELAAYYTYRCDYSGCDRAYDTRQMLFEHRTRCRYEPNSRHSRTPSVGDSPSTSRSRRSMDRTDRDLDAHKYSSHKRSVTPDSHQRVSSTGSPAVATSTSMYTKPKNDYTTAISPVNDIPVNNDNDIRIPDYTTGTFLNDLPVLTTETAADPLPVQPVSDPIDPLSITTTESCECLTAYNAISYERPISDGQNVCPECDKSFIKLKGLNDHRRAVHSVQPTYLCSDDGCGQTFYTQRQLKSHIREHKSPNMCHVCHKWLRRPLALALHNHALHGLPLPHPCDYDGCDKQCVTKAQLIWHKYHFNHFTANDYDMRPNPTPTAIAPPMTTASVQLADDDNFWLMAMTIGSLLLSPATTTTAVETTGAVDTRAVQQFPARRVGQSPRTVPPPPTTAATTSMATTADSYVTLAPRVGQRCRDRGRDYFSADGRRANWPAVNWITAGGGRRCGQWFVAITSVTAHNHSRRHWHTGAGDGTDRTQWGETAVRGVGRHQPYDILHRLPPITTAVDTGIRALAMAQIVPNGERRLSVASADTSPTITPVPSDMEIDSDIDDSSDLLDPPDGGDFIDSTTSQVLPDFCSYNSASLVMEAQATENPLRLSG